MTTRHAALLAILGSIPSIAAAASVSGRITLLDGTPVSGAVVKVGDSLASTSASGAFALGTPTTATRERRIGTHAPDRLDVRNGRIVSAWDGRDLLGRPTPSLLLPEKGRSGRSLGSSRPDSLFVYWSGKRLAVLPFGSDTADVRIRLDTSWRDDQGIPWNIRIPYGSLRDPRDGRTYRTVALGGRTWMAENLDYAATGSLCYDRESDNCRIYGRLYTWAGVMDTAEIANALLVEMGLPRRGICPSGWHVPSIGEWDRLRDFVGGLANGVNLKSTSGWWWTASGNGPDLHGFRALPGGYRGQGEEYFFEGYDAGFWTSSESESGWSWCRAISADSTVIYEVTETKTNGNSLRCIADTAVTR